MLTGSILVEVAYLRPGLGRFTVEAVLARDLSVVQGIVLLGATGFVLANLAVDIVRRILGPRCIAFK